MYKAVANMRKWCRYVSFRPATKTFSIANMFISTACGVLMICISVLFILACWHISLRQYFCSSTASSPVHNPAAGMLRVGCFPMGVVLNMITEFVPWLVQKMGNRPGA